MQSCCTILSLIFGVVKNICFFFAVLILALALYPCGDQACKDEQRPAYAIVNANNQAHDTGEGDVCSPLCICACCSVQVQLVSPSAPLSYIHWAPDTSRMTAYQENIYLVSSHSIWQPPKA